MLLIRTLLISSLTLLAAADTTTPAAPAAPTITNLSAPQVNLLSDLSLYRSTKTTDPAYAAALAAITSVIPTSALSQIGADPTGLIQSVITGTGTALSDWYSAVPTSARSVLSSVISEEVAIASKDIAKGPAPTNGVGVVGAALAAGVAALAVL
jgi:hypothetical protein